MGVTVRTALRLTLRRLRVSVPLLSSLPRRAQPPSHLGPATATPPQTGHGVDDGLLDYLTQLYQAGEVFRVSVAASAPMSPNHAPNGTGVLANLPFAFPRQSPVDAHRGITQ